MVSQYVGGHKNLAVSMYDLQEKIFELLAGVANASDRAEKIDVSKCRCSFTEDEKKRCNSYNKISSLTTLPNEFAIIFFNKKKEKFLLVSSGINCNMQNGDFEIQEPSFSELAVVNKAKKLSLVKDVKATEVLYTVLIYDDPNYDGNSFDDIKKFFRPFSLFKVNNTAIKETDDYCVYAYFLLNCIDTEESKFEPETIMAIEDLLFSGIKVPYYNIVMALNSQQWVHVFLETYRMIEHVFPAVYLKKLTSINSKVTAHEMAVILEEVVDWRPPEDKAIEEIFKELEAIPSFSTLIAKLRGLMRDPNEKIFKWYYKQVRNQVVHYRSVHKNVEFTDAEWNILVRFNFVAIKHLYDAYKDQISITESVFPEK